MNIVRTLGNFTELIVRGVWLLVSSKNYTEVIIDGKVITLGGYESEEYLQKVAAFINGKIAELKEADGFKKLPFDTQSTLIELNIADDYFKAKKLADTMESDMENKDKELYDIKHELISPQIKLDAANQENKELTDEKNELLKKIVKLETEIDDLLAK